jgi:hypothetical protein
MAHDMENLRVTAVLFAAGLLAVSLAVLVVAVLIAAARPTPQATAAPYQHHREVHMVETPDRREVRLLEDMATTTLLGPLPAPQQLPALPVAQDPDSHHTRR